MKTPNGYQEINEIFGNPSAPDGTVNPIWEEKHIRKISPPPGWQLWYQGSSGPVKVSGIRIHMLLKDSFQSALRGIWNHARDNVGSNATEQEIRVWINERRLDLHGGGYNYRSKRGNDNLSLHSYGIAIDWDPLSNPRKTPLTKTLPDWWYEIWQANGWHNGCAFATPDPMHIQFARGA